MTAFRAGGVPADQRTILSPKPPPSCPENGPLRYRQGYDHSLVADYKAVSLKADNPKALHLWLDEHEYATRPDLDKWLGPYVKAGWVITAFQITKPDSEKAALSTQAVRMTFKTESPFYPDAEPADQREQGARRPGRLLRHFVLGTARMQGKLDHPTTWPGRAAWANTLSAERRDKLIERLGGAVKANLAEQPWLTVFDDPSSPRPGVADLFFSVSSDQTTSAAGGQGCRSASRNTGRASARSRFFGASTARMRTSGERSKTARWATARVASRSGTARPATSPWGRPAWLRIRGRQCV